MFTEYQRYRLYEILPGLSIWFTLVGSIVLSFVQPLWMIYVIILFDIYWVLKVLNFSFYLIVAWSRFAHARKTDWKDKLYHEVPDWQSKHHVVFLTLYNEGWDVVKTAVQSVCDAAYDTKAFTIVVAGEEREKAHYESILRQIQETFGACFGDVVGTCHPMNLPDEIPGKGSNLHYAERQMQTYIDVKGWSYDDVSPKNTGVSAKG